MPDENPIKEILALTPEEVGEFEGIKVFLASKKVDVTFGAIGERVTYCNLTEEDGWQTVGLSYTKDPAVFSYDVGKFWALKEAIQNFQDNREYKSSITVASHISNLTDRIL